MTKGPRFDAVPAETLEYARRALQERGARPPPGVSHDQMALLYAILIERSKSEGGEIPLLIGAEVQRYRVETPRLDGDG